MAEPLIRLEQVTKSFAGRPILERLTWSLDEGECAVILGPSGSGKTVFLSTLLGFIQPDRGRVLHPGFKGGGDLFAQTAVLFQEDALLDDRDVQSNLVIALLERVDLFTGPFDSATEQAIDRALADVGLDPKRVRHQLPSMLSGGMRRRVALARALIRNPRLLIADEPTSGLDPDTSVAIYDLMAGLIDKKSMSVVIITHDPLCAARLGNPIYYFTPRVGGLKRFAPEGRSSAERPTREELLHWVEAIGAEAGPEARPPVRADPVRSKPWARLKPLVIEGLDTLGRAILLFRLLRHAPGPRLLARGLRQWGLDSLGLTVLIFALMGVVLEVQAERAITDYGFSNRLPELLAMSLTRLAPAVVGFLMAGRCGSAVAARAGWMELSGQNKALRTMRIDPDAAFFPALLWSWLVVVPLLALLGMAVAWGASWAMLATGFGRAQITARYFLSELPAEIDSAQLALAVGKCLLIAAGLASIAYSGGVSPKRSAADVTRAITRGLVLSIVWIALVDAFASLAIAL